MPGKGSCVAGLVIAAKVWQQRRGNCFQPIKQRSLAWQDFLSSDGQIEPARAIDLGKRLHSSGLRWPFDFEQVASDVACIEIAAGRKGVHSLAAGLADVAEGEQ